MILVRLTRTGQALAINGTPTFIIGDEIVRGTTDLASLERLVAETRVAE